MARYRCAIHDAIFDSNLGAPGSDPSFPLGKNGELGHPDCDRCNAEKDGPKLVTTDDVNRYASENQVSYDVAAVALSEQGYGISDDPEVHKAAAKERADKAVRQAKRVAAVGRSNPNTLPAFKPATSIAAPAQTQSAPSLVAQPTLTAPAPKTITAAALKDMAAASNLSFDAAKQQAETQGFTVVEQ